MMKLTTRIVVVLPQRQRMQALLAYEVSNEAVRRTFSSSLEPKGPKSPLKRAMDFNKATLQLYEESQRYSNIKAAASTARNIWSSNGSIPRRQRRQLVNFEEDLSIVLPIVTICMVPVIGTFVLLPVVLAPRQILSRQFHNSFEREQYAFLAWRQRQEHFEELAHFFCSTAQLDPQLLLTIDDDKLDPSNIVFVKFQETPRLQELDLYSRSHMISLALVAGFAQRFGSNLASFFASSVPTSSLRRFIRHQALSLVDDDEALRKESAVETACMDLTEEEVMEACLLRCLSLLGGANERRRRLTEYLSSTALLSASMHKDSINKLAFGLLCLHLQPLRKYSS